MDITKDTTEEQIWEPIKKAKERLLETVNLMHNSEILAGHVINVAEAEGAAQARYTYLCTLKGVLEAGRSEDEAVKSAKEATMALLFQSPNDTWSGRRNDARRAYVDGLRAEVTFLVRGY